MKKRIYILSLYLLIVAPFFSLKFITFIVDKAEEKPLSESTINQLTLLDSIIVCYANKYNIPKEALSAAIGSEINRRVSIGKLIDNFQDDIFNSQIVSEGFLNKQLNSKANSKYLNITKQDIGLGNIKFETAVRIVNENPDEFLFIHSMRDLIKYLLTTEGNIHIASLYILKGKNLFNRYYKNSTQITKNAILYSFYKEGENYYFRYITNSLGKRPPIPHPNGIDILEKLNTTLYKNNSGLVDKTK